MIEHQHTAPGPIALLTEAMSIFKTDGRFYGTLALLSAGHAIGLTGVFIVLRSQPIWIQLAIQLGLILLSILVSAGFTVAINGALGRSADGVEATWAGVGDDLRRSYLPVLGMMILVAVIFSFCFGIVAAAIFAGGFAYTLMELPAVYGAILLLILVVTIPIAIYYFNLRLALASAAIVVGRLGPWEAIKASWIRARGYVLKIFVLYLVMVPVLILTSVPTWVFQAGAESSVDPQDPFGALNYTPPPIVDAISLVTGAFIAVVGLWIAAALALLWLHLAGERTTSAITE